MSYSAASPQVLEANASGGAGRIDAAAWSYSALAATGVTTLAWCGGFPNPVLGAGVAGAALASAAGARYGAGRGHWLLARLSAAACGAAGAYAGVQATCQNPEYNLYERTYVTDAKTANLEAFYGEDKLMEIFCIFPPVVKVLMQSGYWDDDGNYHPDHFINLDNRPGRINIRQHDNFHAHQIELPCAKRRNCEGEAKN